MTRGRSGLYSHVNAGKRSILPSTSSDPGERADDIRRDWTAAH